MNECNVLLVSKYPSTVSIRFVLADALNILDPLRHPAATSPPFKQASPADNRTIPLERSGLKKQTRRLFKLPSSSLRSRQRERPDTGGKELKPQGRIRTDSELSNTIDSLEILDPAEEEEEDHFEIISPGSNSYSLASQQLEHLRDQVASWRGRLERCLAVMPEEVHAPISELQAVIAGMASAVTDDDDAIDACLEVGVVVTGDDDDAVSLAASVAVDALDQ